MESESTTEAEKSLQRSEKRSHEIEAEIASNPARFRLLTGDRPTGRLHILYSKEKKSETKGR